MTEATMNWNYLYHAYGYTYQQSPLFYNAYRRAYPEERLVIIEGDLKGNSFLSAFTVDIHYATCLFVGWPVLSQKPFSTEDWTSFLTLVHLQTQPTQGVYLPLVFRDLPGGEDLVALPELHIAERLASPTISWASQGFHLLSQARNRLGSFVDRQIKRFENRNFSCRYTNSQEAIDVISFIEKRSWKAKCEQDMFSRNQFNLYKHLIESNLCYVYAAFDADIPIAYQMDSRVGKRVISVKASFNDDYKSYSPGFYLATCGYLQQYSTTQLEEIDLFGSPDILKDSLCTSSKARCDLGWPSTKAIMEKIEERRQYEAKVRQNYEAKLSIQKIYS